MPAYCRKETDEVRGRSVHFAEVPAGTQVIIFIEVLLAGGVHVREGTQEHVSSCCSVSTRNERIGTVWYGRGTALTETELAFQLLSIWIREHFSTATTLSLRGDDGVSEGCGAIYASHGRNGSRAVCSSISTQPRLYVQKRNNGKTQLLKYSMTQIFNHSRTQIFKDSIIQLLNK